MPIPKMLKSDLATEHLIVTKKQKAVIHAMAKKERRRISQVVKDMINRYTDKDASYKQYII